MITIRYSNSSLVVVGHANFAKENDIVCAAVSGVVYGALNWFKKKEAKIIINKKENKISVRLFKFNKKIIDQRIFLLIKQLKTIQKQFKKNILIQKTKIDYQYNEF